MESVCLTNTTSLVKKLIIFSVFLAAVLTSCTNKPQPSEILQTVSCDLDSIIRRGKLIAVTDFSSTNYFIYKGEPMGFNYELLKSFADHIGVDLEIITENSLETAFNLLNKGEVDLLAIGLTVNAPRKKEIIFTDPIMETRQVLVQRKPRKWKTMTADAVDDYLIRNQLDLAHKTIYVQAYSSHSERLKTLAGEIGDSISIIEVPFDSEELIKNVANGEIDYTVCDENIALVNSTYYHNIDINTPVSFNQNIAWGIGKYNTEHLLGELNHWINSYRNTREYAFLYAKYFKNPSQA